MGIMGIATITFVVTVVLSWVLYHAVDLWITTTESESHRDAEKELEEYYWFVMSKFLYASFFAFLLFIFSICFATEFLYGTVEGAFNYLLIVIPVTILGAMVVFFLARQGVSRYIH